MEQADKEDKLEKLTVLWTQTQPTVAAFISSAITNFHDAEDVLQKVAMVLAKKYDQYDPKKPFVAWAIGIARYEILVYQRTKATDKAILSEEILAQAASVFEDTHWDQSPVRDALKKCISDVKGRNKQLLELSYVRELKPTRIARQLGMTSNAIFVALHRLRMALRECIQRRLSQEEAHG